ncbi:MAG TPA: WXG100 family type VII secretion target [Microbacteriaceae bacterium]|nr:WXG100 family type VII secretion target [Microbacteriaceae bacterium]HQX35765.1 WXG100 family type VII secretion target [Microbacteriaceae bacterium]HQZ47217.1 WXG100 family type VII secretion target [Microbacteriaceae bacterium]HRA08884.1 WXG100 family type VII secretion target [Microbacteriaceae bacterium]
MANLNVSYGDMKTAAGQLITGKGALEDKLGELQRLVGDLVASGFVTDAASGAFNDSYTQFTTGATQMVGGIQGLSDFLNAAADALGNTDSELANAIRS